MQNIKIEASNEIGRYITPITMTTAFEEQWIEMRAPTEMKMP